MVTNIVIHTGSQEITLRLAQPGSFDVVLDLGTSSVVYLNSAECAELAAALSQLAGQVRPLEATERPPRIDADQPPPHHGYG